MFRLKLLNRALWWGEGRGGLLTDDLSLWKPSMMLSSSASGREYLVASPRVTAKAEQIGFWAAFVSPAPTHCHCHCHCACQIMTALIPSLSLKPASYAGNTFPFSLISSVCVELCTTCRPGRGCQNPCTWEGQDNHLPPTTGIDELIA